MSKKTKYILILFLCLLLIIIYIFWVKKDMSDFGVCYQAGKRIMMGETLYRAADGHLQYKYSPCSAVFFSLFSLLPQEAAKLIWYALELILLGIVYVVSYGLLPHKLKPKGWVIGLSFLVLLKFTAREIELGQINILIIFLLLMVLVALLKKKDTGSGVLWGVSLLFKPYALVFLPYFLLKKRIRVILFGMSTVLVGLLLPSLFYGMRGNIVVLGEWRQSLSLSTSPLLSVYDNASLHAFFLNIVPSENRDLAWVFILGLAVLTGAAFLWLMGKGKKAGLQKPEVLEFSYLCILIPLLSPLGWYYNYLYSLLAVVVLLNDFESFPSLGKFFLVMNFIVIGASLREILGKEAFRFYTGYSLVALNHLIILFFLFYLRLRQARIGSHRA